MRKNINIEGVIQKGLTEEFYLNECKVFTCESSISLSNTSFKEFYEINLKPILDYKKCSIFKDGILLMVKGTTYADILLIDEENSISYLNEKLSFSTSLSLNIDKEPEFEIYIIDASFEINEEATLHCFLSYMVKFHSSALDKNEHDYKDKKEFNLIDIEREFT